jgi:hypothetical protein
VEVFTGSQQNPDLLLLLNSQGTFWFRPPAEKERCICLKEF